MKIVALLFFLAAGPVWAQSESTHRLEMQNYRDPEGPNRTTLNIGPAYTSGLSTDRALVDIKAAFLHNFTSNVAGLVSGDAVLGSGSDPSRFLNLAFGGEFYLNDSNSQIAPYVAADAGFGMTRNANQSEQNGMAFGAGVGFRLAGKPVAWDVNLHYTTLAVANDNKTPTVLALRGGVIF